MGNADYLRFIRCAHKKNKFIDSQYLLLTSINVIKESESRREPTDAGAAFRVNLEDRSSLDSVSICFRGAEEQLKPCTKKYLKALLDANEKRVCFANRSREVDKFFNQGEIACYVRIYGKTLVWEAKAHAFELYTSQT